MKLLRHPRSKIVTEFVDELGDKKIIHKDHRGRLAFRRNSSTTAALLTQIVAPLIGNRIKKERLKQGMTMRELGEKAGMAAASNKYLKSRINEIEHGMRGGIRFGTLYAFALALEVNPRQLLPTINEVLEHCDIDIKPTVYSVVVSDKDTETEDD